MSVAQPPTRIEPSLVYLDSTGKPRIVGTGIKVRIVAEWFNDGRTPEQMKEAWAHAPLAGIYSAIAYYLDHKAAIDAEIAELKKFADQSLKEFVGSPLHQKFLELRRRAQP